MRNCYNKALAKDPSASGKITMSLRIDKMGEVVSAKVVCTTLPKELTECVRVAATKFKFEPGSAGTFTVGDGCN